MLILEYKVEIICIAYYEFKCANVMIDMLCNIFFRCYKVGEEMSAADEK